MRVEVNWGFEVCADDVRAFCDALGIARPVVYGHSLGGYVAMVYAARHPGHAGALVLQSTNARFDLVRIVEAFRRAGGDEVAEIVERVYGGDRPSVTAEEWARCWTLFGPWVTGEQEQARTIVNRELNAPGLELAAAREIVDALPDRAAQLEVIERAGHFPWKDAPDRYWTLVTDFCGAQTERAR